jgi:hypothetical protein
MEAYWLRAAGSSETNPTVTSLASDQWIGIIYVIRGAFTTGDPFTDTNSSNSSGTKATIPSLTTTIADALIIGTVCNRSDFNTTTPEHGLMVAGIGDDANGASLTGTWTYQESIGTVTAHDLVAQRNFSFETTAFVVSVKDDGNGHQKGYVNKASPPATLIHGHFGSGRTGHLGGTATKDPTAYVSAINSITTRYKAYSEAGTYIDDMAKTRVLTNSTVNGNYDVAASTLASSQDLSNTLISLVSDGSGSIDSLTNGGKVFGLGDGTNTAFWQIEGADSLQKSKFGVLPFVFDINNTKYDEIGTFNPASVSELLTGIVSTSNLGFEFFGSVNSLDTMIINGGSATLPASYSTASDIAGVSFLRTVQNQNAQAQDQYLVTQSIQIGDGTLATYWDSTNESIEFPAAYDSSGKRIQLNIDSAALSVTVKAGASDTINLTNTTINFGDFHNFVTDTASSTSATYDFSGLSIFNATPKLNSNGGSISGMTMSGCKEVTWTSALLDMSGGCTFDNLASGEAQYLTISSEAEWNKLENCTFKNAARAIRVTGDQSGTWQNNSLTVSNNTVDIRYEGATNFSINATPGTYSIQNAGAGTLSLSVVTTISVSNANLVAGSRVQLYNVTQAAEIENVTLAGVGYTSATLTLGTEYNSGDTLRLRATQISGATAKAEYEENAVATTVNISFVGAQVSDDVYDTYAIDGSTVTGFAADYAPDDEVDVTVASNFTMASFYAWWVYNNTTTQGMQEFYGGISAVDAANLRVNTSVVPIYMDNTTATNLRQTDTIRFYRDDAAYPVRDPTTGGGGLDVNWQTPVLIVMTGSALTAPQAAELTQASTAAANATAIANVEAKVDIVDSTVDAIFVDTRTTIPATLSTIEGKIDVIDITADAILVDTGTTIPITLAAQDVILNTLLDYQDNKRVLDTTANTLTAYADDGTTPLKVWDVTIEDGVLKVIDPQ